MKRPNYWLRLLFLLSLLLALIEYVAMSWLAPHDILRAIERAIGGQVVAERTQLAFPLTTILTGLRLTSNSQQAAFAIQRMTLRLRWMSLSRRTLYFDQVVVEQPTALISRGPGGTVFWPAVPLAPAGSDARVSGWRLHIDTLQIVDGGVEVIDEQLPVPFHGLLDHAAVEIGPLLLPLDRDPFFFAARGRVVGLHGGSAAAYCSGWLGLVARDLDAACRTEPIALEAFEPYYQGRTKLRVYTTTLSSTSQWAARDNQLTSRIQLELGNLGEGDVSIRGRTIVDVKKAGGVPAHLRAEIHLSGLLDHPRGWTGQFLPDAAVQQMMQRLLDRGVETIRISLPGSQVRMSITPPSQATSGNIEAATKEIHEVLELLASSPEEEPDTPPVPDAAPPTVPGPAPAVPQALDVSPPVAGR